MNLANGTTDQAILAELGGRLHRARFDGNLTQAGLTQKAEVSKCTAEPSGIRSSGTTEFRFHQRMTCTRSARSPRHAHPGTSALSNRQLKMHGKKRQSMPAAEIPRPSSPQWAWGNRSRPRAPPCGFASAPLVPGPSIKRTDSPHFNITQLLRAAASRIRPSPYPPVAGFAFPPIGKCYLIK